MANRLITEKYFPVVFAGLTGFALWFFDIRVNPQKLDSVINSAISISAILMGFLGTAKAMLLSFRSPKYTWLKARPVVWGLLLGYFRSALLSNFVLCVASIILLAVSLDKVSDMFVEYVIPIWAGLFAYAISCFYRVLLVFFALLNSE